MARSREELNRLRDYRLDKVNGRIVNLYEMLRFRAQLFVKLSRRIEALANREDLKLLVDSRTTVMNDALRKRISSEFPVLEKHCDQLNLKMCSAHVSKILKSLENPEFTYAQLMQLLVELQNRLEDELRLSLFLQVDSRKADYYEQRQSLFGEEVTQRFPSAAFDIEEAGKCYAIGRDTACVFHLMRVMEVGLNAVAKGIGIPLHIPSWDGILKKINDEITKKSSNPPADWKRLALFYAEVAANLYAVKDAWRNPTMHVDRVYDEDRALSILNAVRAFMQYIATELTE